MTIGQSRLGRGAGVAFAAGGALLLLGLCLFMPAHAKANPLAGVVEAVAPAGQPTPEKVWFHHPKRDMALYCLDRNYWWFYRPYQDASQDYARCMPYFHYPEQASGQGRQGSSLK